MYGRYLFKLTLSGYGNTPGEAWRDAIEGFNEDPGPTPDKEDYTFEKEEQ